MKVRTRFAPSPTGHLHIGGVRTALYAFAMAHKYQGEFLLRIEDTDRKRYVEGSEQEVLDMLDAYSIPADEDVKKGGAFGPYRQSDRLDLYKKYAEQLVEQGDAYYCFATSEEIAEERKRAEANHEHFFFRSPYRDLPLSEAKEMAKKKKYVIRQKLPANTEVHFEDVVQGKMVFNTNDTDETVLLKSDGFPTYHLAVVVDDHLMEITHVFRGVEWLPSTPKHILLYKALGWEMPKTAHLTVILDPAGGKLSKRKGAVSAYEFLKEGYLPEAVLNFLMLLGWSSPEARVHGEKEREIFSLTDFVDLFEMEQLNKSSPVFNREKLLWFNQKYMQIFSLDQLENRFVRWLKEYYTDEQFKGAIVEKGPDYLQQIIKLEQTRIKIFADLPEAIRFYYLRPAAVDMAAIKQLGKVNKEQRTQILETFSKELAAVDEHFSDWPHEQWEQSIRSIAEKAEVKAGDAFMVLRVAVTGTPVSPPLYEAMQILGKTEILARLKAISK